MKLDEFAFVNQQLAGMLKSGVPLEGALRQLCETITDAHRVTPQDSVRRRLEAGPPNID